MRSPQQHVDAFNAAVRPGDRVTYTKDDSALVATSTSSEAAVLGGHTAVVWLEGVSGCVALWRVRKGIPDDGPFEKEARRCA